MNTDLKPGDVLFTSSDRLLGRLIRWGERSPGEQEPDVNHAAIVVEGGDFKDAIIIEALKVVERNNLFVSHGADLVFGYRAKTLPLIVINEIVKSAERRVGEGYGYLEILSQLVDSKVFGGRVVFRNAGLVDKKPICSRLVAECYGVQGVTFGIPSQAADPDTMHQFCDAHPELWDLVLDYSPE